MFQHLEVGQQTSVGIHTGTGANKQTIQGEGERSCGKGRNSRTCVYVGTDISMCVMFVARG